MRWAAAPQSEIPVTTSFILDEDIALVQVPMRQSHSIVVILLLAGKNSTFDIIILPIRMFRRPRVADILYYALNYVLTRFIWATSCVWIRSDGIWMSGYGIRTRPNVNSIEKGSRTLRQSRI
jgi:hypothetical protein